MAELADLETSETFEIDDLDASAFTEFAMEQGWGDGMPVIPPTEAAVARFIEMCRGDNEPFGPITPRLMLPTLRSLAANAVMAGCKAEYFPVVLAALRGVLVPAYNLHGTLATTHSCGQMILVTGPLRHELSINFGSNCFGQGWRANATIGRALALILRNIGGALPGTTDRSTQGSPAKYSFCFGENEEESPWPSYRLRNGFSADDSVVTVAATEPPHNINDHASTSADGLLTTFVSVMSQSGSNSQYAEGPTFLAIGPEHAATLHRDGWNIEALQNFLFEHARIPVAQMSPENQQCFREANRLPDGDSYTLVPSAKDIHIVVAGGAGKHSAWIPTFGMTAAVSVRVKR